MVEKLVDTKEAKLLESLKICDWSATEEIVKSYTSFLLKSAVKMGFDLTQAEELVQNVWVTFFEIIKNFEGRSKIRTFLYGILINKSRELKRDSSRIILEDNIENSLEGMFDEKGNWLQRPIDPESFLSAAQTIEIIQNCLEKLPFQQKQVFILKEVDCEENENICSILKLTNTNVRVLLSRAKNGLRQCIEKKYLAYK